MIRALLAFCIRERMIVLIGCLAAIGYGWYATSAVPLDAIPDIGENQVIVLTEWSGRSPKDIEDQITYPLSVTLQSVPGSKSVRATSMFGFSYVQVTFDADVDFYWARSRVAEQLSTVSSSLPEGVSPRLAPDATALGQIFYYVLEPPPGMDLAELRSKQDFFIKYALQSVDGVAEVASIGGYELQYQIEVDPDALRFHGVSLAKVINAVEDSNIDVGAKVVESGGMESLVRGKGFIGAGKTELETLEQIESTVVMTRDGVPVRVRDVAQVQTGPAIRDGALDYNGTEAVGGVVVMRYRENPRDVIQNVLAKIDSLKGELNGITIKPVYDRTLLIDETVGTLTEALMQETMITIVVVVLFLLHFRASIMIAITLPMAVLMSFAAMHFFGVDANIMSLAGIAIAIGTMVDMGIIVLENIYDALADWEKSGSPGGVKRRLAVIREAAAEVVPAVMTAVSTTIVSFLPVFFLTGRDHKLFSPLAWTKTFALAASLVVAVTVVPMLARVFLKSVKTPKWAGFLAGSGVAAIAGSLMYYVWGPHLQEWMAQPSEVKYLKDVGETAALAFITALAAALGFFIGWWITREHVRPMEKNPVSRFVVWLYAGRLRTALKHKLIMLSLPAIVLLLGLVAWLGLPKILWPAEHVAEYFGADLKKIPGYVEMTHKFTGLPSDEWIALDEGTWFYMPSLYPAASFNQAMEVLQTQDTLIKEIDEVSDVLGKIGRVDSALDPAPVTMIETYVMLKPRNEWRAGMTEEMIWDEINRVATLPGIPTASPLQPIEGRVVMLQSDIRASMAVRILGDSLEGLSAASNAVTEKLKQHPLINKDSVSPTIVLGKPYYEFEVNREEAARFGMTTMMVNQVIAAGLGGVNVTTTVEGRERYPIQVRYSRDVRERLDELPEAPVVTETGEVVPLKQLADVSTSWGPGVIKSENAQLAANVTFVPTGAVGDIETVESVERMLTDARTSGDLRFPPGNFELQYVGLFQDQVESYERLLWIVPTVFLINLLLHYLHFRNFPISLVVFSGIPFAAAGGMIAVAIMGFEMNTAMWVGFIALFGLAADDGIVMATYMRDMFNRRTLRSVSDIRAAIYEAGLKRIRPCTMTTITTLAALLPVLLATGRGSEVAKAMALPVFGGMLIEPLTTFIVPTLYSAYIEFKMRAGLRDEYWSEPQTSSNKISAEPLPHKVKPTAKLPVLH
ncbi:MAG: efflux RND transporter permease subunit [Pirellulales bacterium]|nr:efflux RND transporter permease subunit [Pirellulales bacterium]